MHTRLIRSVAILAALVVGAAIVAGCGDDNKDNGGSSDKKPVNVAFLTWVYADYNQAEEKGVKQALSESDGGGTVKVFNANFDPAAQQKQCEDVISSGRYNAILLSTVTQATGVPCVKAAKAAGIPVATIEQTVGTDPAKYYDLQPQVDGVVAVNTSVLDTQIDVQAELVKGACGDANPCKALYEKGSASDPFSKDIIAGLEKAVPNLEVVQQFTANFDPSAVAKAMPDLLARNPDLNVYIAAADNSALAAVPAIKEAGMTDQLKIIGGSGSRQGVDAIKAGTIYGSNGNWPTQNGAQVTNALIQAVNGEKITDCCVNGVLIDKPLALTKDTVGDYTPEW